MSELIMRVKTNKQGAPNYSTAEAVKTKEIKYYDEEESVWKIGRVIVDEQID